MRIIAFILGYVAVVVAITAVLAWPFMYLWNYAVVQAVGFTNSINYPVAFCLTLFISLFLAGGANNSSRDK